MRAIRVASTAVLGAAALALAAPVASAADGAPAPNPKAARAQAPGDFVVSPSLVAPGGRVTLSAPGCRSTATASASIFDLATIAPGSRAIATVDLDARRGAVYRVTFNCTGGITDTVNLTISGTTATPTTRSTVLATPRGVQGGLGGSVGGVDTATLVAGAGMAVAATAGTVFVVRRRSHLDRGRRH
ncbi:hypothetical protein ACFV9D_00905 [Streptomyces sp. NPDC059875]|uniref:hypothetical protein n=1 Tax=unclassified Streptomyces TaxID=2593676 RepID=UPI003661AFB4